MSNYKVEKGIAIQSIQKRMFQEGLKYSKYPFSEMTSIGESFFVPDEGEGLNKLQRKITSAAAQTGMKFTTQQVYKGATPIGVRVWKGTRKEVVKYFENQQTQGARRKRAA